MMILHRTSTLVACGTVKSEDAFFAKKRRTSYILDRI